MFAAYRGKCERCGREDPMEAESRAPAPPGPAAPEWEPYLRHLVSTLPSGPAATAGESALHAALAERDANAQTAKAMSRLHDDAEKEIEELHATIARLTRDKDHLLTKEDGEYIRERLREAAQ